MYIWYSLYIKFQVLVSKLSMDGVTENFNIGIGAIQGLV